MGRGAAGQVFTRPNALDKLKTHLRGTQIVLRSKSPEVVRQDFYGLLKAHLVVSWLMIETAFQVAADQDRVSFVHSVRVVQRSMARPTALSPSAGENPS